MSGRQIDDIFREAFADYQEKPIQGSWQKISEGIPKPNTFSLVGQWAATVSLLAIVGVFSFLSLDISQNEQLNVAQQHESAFVQNSQQPQQASLLDITSRKPTRSTEASNDLPPVEPMNRISESNSTQLGVVNTTIEKKVQEVGFSDASFKADMPIASEEILPLKGIEYVDGGMIENKILLEVPDKPVLVSDEDQEARNKSINIKGIHIGTVTGYNNTWIINQNTYGEFERGYELDYNYSTHGASYGIRVGYDFSTNFGLEAAWIFNSDKGQSYKGVIWGDHLRKTVRLSYTEIPVVVKYKLSRMMGYYPSVTNLSFGLQYGYLKKAEISILEDMEQTDDYDQTVNPIERFKRHELSLVLGFEKDYYLTKQLFFSIGIRGSIGLNDINSPEWKIPAKLDDLSNKSYNFVVGAIAGINYLIK
ncbi:MAG: PorT family protein [Bacteroidetes bacterium]|nr:PorT family protein [Bacteroidota bacterium]